MSTVVPMFPLGTVLFPHAQVPLHIFEHRYRVLVRNCIDLPSDFGITLIAQGHEVGGGDLRTTVGALARIEEAAEFGDGRWALVVRGIERIRILRWLDDDPYPKAEIESWPDLGDPDPSLERCRSVETLRSATALMAESLGYRPIVSAFDPDMPTAELSLRLSFTSPLGESDRFDLLCAPGPSSRLDLLEQRLLDQQVLFGAEIAMGRDQEDW